MSPLDLILPVAGIALIVLLVWLTGGRRSASIADTDAVRRHLALDHPDFEPGDLRLAVDKRSALVVDRGERRTAVLFALGDRITIRLLAPGDLAGVTARDGDLTLTLADLGARRIALRLGDAEAARAWAARLDRLLIRDAETPGGRSAAVLAS
ncbi:MAG TPA: hypothetical protein VK442_11970 [Xanthobacteraceae bacterium]|nr:hypothetical protein [Xanthobacteraceae bacterium]